MIIIVLGLLLISSFIFDKKNFIFSLMLFFVLFDMFDGFYKDYKVFAAIRYIIPLCLLTIYIFKNDVLKKTDLVFLLFIIFLFALLIFNPGDFLLSAKTTLSIVISVSMLLIGRHLGQKNDFIKAFEPYNRFLLIIVPFYIFYANIFHIGQSYSNNFTTGFMDTSRMYIVPIVVFMGVHYVLNNKKNNAFIKTLDITFIGINLIILIITTRRTSIGMLLGAMVIYILLNRRSIFKMALIFFFLVSSLILSYPLYEKKLNAQLAERERIQHFDTYENEGRYLESLFILNYHKRTKDPVQLFFGIKLFDSLDFGTKYFGYDRTIHSDINMIFFSTGLIGLIVFSLFFGHYLLLGNGKMLPINKKLFYPLLIMFLIVLIPGRFIGTFTFAPLLMLLLTGTKFNRPIRPVKKMIKIKRVKLVHENQAKPEIQVPKFLNADLI